MKFAVSTLAAAAVLAGAAIGIAPATAQRAPTGGTANPASAYCQKIGGRSIVRNTAAGEAGYCRLRNGRTVDEWKLFRDANQKRRPGRRGTPVATGAPNPAAVYCEEQGGLLKGKMTEAGEEAYCHLPGGRVIEEWEFFRQGQSQGSPR